jgi:hypothetical protein
MSLSQLRDKKSARKTLLLVNGGVRGILSLFVLVGRCVLSDGWFYISEYFCIYPAVPARKSTAQNRNGLTVLVVS